MASEILQQGPWQPCWRRPAGASSAHRLICAGVSNSAREIIGIFTMLGFGMTLPCLVVAFVPEVATPFSKPGPWMNYLRALLGFALALTAAWLLWVLSITNYGSLRS